MLLLKKIGFTLAEVLIVLGIIGNVAVATLPTLLMTINNTQYKSAYKNAYSKISQAFLIAKNEGEIIPLTGSYSSQGMQANFAILQKYFKVTKSCTNSNTGGCWNTSGELWISESYSTAGFIDVSGMAWKLRNTDAVTLLPAILVDTNGLLGPNKYGKDRFPLFLNNSVSSDPWNNLFNNSPIGMPTRISPHVDIPQGTLVEHLQVKCPSYATNSCNYSSWLTGS